MNRNQYENTRDYKKALKILKGFVDEELDGDMMQCGHFVLIILQSSLEI